MLLIRNGLVIDTEPAPYVQEETDILIDDHGRIAAVGKDLEANDAKVIDASGHIVIPGFVDTHRHVWEAALRQMIPDHTLPQYMEKVFPTLPRFGPADMYNAQLAGNLEAVYTGITTVVDFTFRSAEDTMVAALEGTIDSGIRSVFGHGSDGSTEQTDALERRREFVSDAEQVTIALAPLGPQHGDSEATVNDWQVARALGLHIVVHLGGSDAERVAKAFSMLEKEDLLGPDVLYLHGNSLDDRALTAIAESGGTLSVCPALEMAMQIGYPMTGPARAAGVVAGLGIDVVTGSPGDMFSQMRAAYLYERLQGNPFSVADALRMATLDGAIAAGTGDDTGSLRPGKWADLALLRRDLPGMAAAHDPIAAVVLSADTAAVDTVLVGGQVLKHNGVLMAHDMAEVAAKLSTTARRVAA